MLDCPGCKRLYEGAACPVCGKAGREPQMEDACLVYSGGQIWAEMAADVLRQNEIPSMCQNHRGAAMAVFTGMLADTYEVYVPFGAFEQADGILTELFSAQETDLEEEELDSEELESESEEEE